MRIDSSRTIVEVDEDLIRDLSKLVKPGESITFPNGITIDKRVPLGGTSPSPLPPVPPWIPVVPPHRAWQCTACGVAAPASGGFGYVCSRTNCPSGLSGPQSAYGGQC